MASFSSKTTPLLLLFILFEISSCQEPTYPNPFIPNGLDSYIVITEKPPTNEDIKHFSLRILSKAIGGDKVASFALLYTYSYATTGFAARLSIDQVSALGSKFFFSFFYDVFLFYYLNV